MQRVLSAPRRKRPGRHGEQPRSPPGGHAAAGQLRDQHAVLKPPCHHIQAGALRSFKDSATKQELVKKTLEDPLKLGAKNGTWSASDTAVGNKQ